MHGVYPDRAAGGRALVDSLRRYAGRSDVVVLGLPRGGVLTAAAVAAALGAPVDVCVVRKLGVPWQPELAMGAVASGGVELVDADVVRGLGIAAQAVAAVAARERVELARQEAAFRLDRPPVDLSDAVAIVVDDGVATGWSARAALRAVRARGAARVVLAVPVAPAESLAALAGDADEVVCPWTPVPFQAVGSWYADFTQVSDEQVRAALAAVRAPGAPPS